MRATLVILIVCFASIALADDFKTINGKEYKNAKVSRVEPDGIVITFSGGMVKIPFTELPPEIQKKYGYDPQAAAAYSTEQYEQNAALARQRKAEEQQRLEERQKYWSEHPTTPAVQQKSAASSMQGGMLDEGPAGPRSSTHGSMLDERPAGPQVSVYGTVINVVDEGLLISAHGTPMIGGEQIPSHAPVLLMGNFPGFYDGDKVLGTGHLAGSYDYTNVSGSRKHARALKNASVTKLTQFPY